MEQWPLLMNAVLLDTCARFFIAAQNERALAFLPVDKRLANLLLLRGAARPSLENAPCSTYPHLVHRHAGDVVEGETARRRAPSRAARGQPAASIGGSRDRGPSRRARRDGRCRAARRPIDRPRGQRPAAPAAVAAARRCRRRRRRRGRTARPTPSSSRPGTRCRWDVWPAPTPPASSSRPSCAASAPPARAAHRYREGTGGLSLSVLVTGAGRTLRDAWRLPLKMRPVPPIRWQTPESEGVPRQLPCRCRRRWRCPCWWRPRGPRPRGPPPMPATASSPRAP